MTYQPGIPTGSVPLNQDYLNIQGNFTQLNTQFEVDHVPLTSTSGTPPNGYHEAIHLVPISTPTSNPPNNSPINGYTATPGYGQLFDATTNDGNNTDQSLYFLTGGNRLMTLTRNFQPVALSNGYTFLPGGLILQWGTLTAVSRTVTAVTFASLGGIVFPGGCFNVQATLNTPGSPDAIVLSISAVSGTGFSYNSTSATVRNYFWMAIGA